jgi:hypothetical protein
MADAHGTLKRLPKKRRASLGTFAMYRAALRSLLNTHLDTAFWIPSHTLWIWWLLLTSWTKVEAHGLVPPLSRTFG